ncbi:putative 28S rRNA (cytosine-C(5))-methyltransferase [Chionoecetes opilio]|uniref:Putative 28S rRNA (Cytosine-C(5))-methyltransferase n=1 Tax=Chionoecetes opilio TaxID=41210 RepID=A0A8J5CG17_CHIOP|nr:putative 28S rRNA (cytosine-C(5))-methyltransferase [Chionoecetes opilio]
MEEGSVSGKRPHSVPVPQLYKEASKILQRLERKEGSLKTLVYSGRYKNYKKIYALLCKAWNHSSVIKQALEASRIFEEQPNFNPHLAHILTAELLGKGSLPGNCKPIQVLRKYEEELRSTTAHHLTKETLKHESSYPRYVRVNTLRASVEDVQARLSKEGWSPTHYDRDHITYDDFLQLLEASCLPVFISNLQPGASVIDACAAPGNKTSQIAAAINNTGSVVASEKSFKRYKTLDKLLRQRGATCVCATHTDFTKLPQSLIAGTEHIFLDPTCSSSGTDLHQDEIDDDRLQSLAVFQGQLLQHALSHASVQEVVYSTCSVNAEENEEVVQKALGQHQDFELEDLASKLCGWKHFGKESYEFGKYCIRTVPEIDKCHGFFVAKFVRKNSCDTKVAKKNKKKMNKSSSKEACRKHKASEDVEYSSMKRKRK